MIKYTSFRFNQFIYTGGVFAFSLMFGLLLANLPVDVFYDRDNYLDYADTSLLIFVHNLSKGLLSFIANEPLWLGINVFFSYFFSAENTVRITIFFSSFIISYKVLIYKPKYFILLLFFLMLPQVLKNNIVHLRQGLAISVFLIGYFSKNRFINPFFLLMSIFIHSSFVFIVFFYYLNIIFLHLRLAADVRATLVLIFGVFISLLGLSIAGMLGARQGVNAEYTSFGGRNIGFGFLFWLSILLLYFSAGKQFLKEQSLSIIILLFYISTYLFFPVTARVFESGLILVLLTGLHLNGKNLLIFLSAFFIYFILQWAIRLGTPYYGWA